MTRALFTILAALADRVGEPQPLSRALFERFWREEHYGSGGITPGTDGRAHFRHQDECYGIDFELTRGEPRVIATLLWSDTRPHEDIPEQELAPARLVCNERERVAPLLEFYEEMRSKLGERAYRWSAWWTGSMERARGLVAIMNVIEDDAGIIRAVAKVGGDEVLIELDEVFGSGTWRVRLRTPEQRRLEKLRIAHDLMDQHKLTRREAEQHMPA